VCPNKSRSKLFYPAPHETRRLEIFLRRPIPALLLPAPLVAALLPAPLVTFVAKAALR
jgi:hypothetical protein